MAGTRTLVLGGGFGGAAAALTVRELLPPAHTVTVIDRSADARLCGINPLVAVGARPAGSMTRSLALLSSAGIEVIVAEIGAIDIAARTVTTDRGSHGFDHLVVALGAGYDWTAIPGSEAAHTFYHHEGAERLRDRLAGLDGGTVAVAVAAPPVKCPPAAIEGILLIEEWARRRQIRDRVDLHLAVPEPAPLAVAGPAVAKNVVDLLSGGGITLHTGAALAEVAGSGSEARLGDGSAIHADVLAVVPALRVPDVVEKAGLTGGARWVPVDPATLETAVPGVFAVGDVNVVPTATAYLPKAGAFASGQGRSVGASIASRVLGTDAPPPYDGTGACFLAVSAEASAAVGGTFLGPDPQVTLGAASAEGMVGMERWEEDWRAFRI